jgi:hydroxymethylglutaryl-CoA reductase
MTDPHTSRLPGLHRRSLAERRALLAQRLKDGDIRPLLNGGLDDALLDRMVENAVGRIAVPVGIAANFLVNGREVLVPMAVEEPSVIAGASHAARLAREGGGFRVRVSPSFTVAQVELRRVVHPGSRILDQRDRILAAADAVQPQLVSLGGGARDLEVREQVGDAHRTVVHLVVDCLDAMGANMVNTMAEAVAPLLEELSGGRAGLRILTNLADRRLAVATCAIPIDQLERPSFTGREVAEGIVAAGAFAAADPWRAATHNKGIFNGIDPILLATGNDWRAVEAGGHAYAARSGTYRPLSGWTMEEGMLRGELELPMAVGVVGGASRCHPCAVKCLELMNVTTAAGLSEIATAAGLASNLAALLALSTEGIQAGHMRLHRRRL